MVSIQIKQLALFFILILFATVSFSSPRLYLFLDKSESALGRPIRAELYGVSLTTKITEVNLERLNDQFGIITDYVINDTRDKRWPNKVIQILKLKLYPRTTGIISVPKLSINGAISKKQSIQVNKGKTSIPKILFSTQNPYERQQIIIRVLIESSDSNARLSLKNEQSISGFNATALPFKRTKIKKGIYLLQIGWAISALKPGQQILNFPPIEYSISGVSRKQFYLSPKKLNIVSLPSYLPPTLPVGKVSIQSELLTSNILQTDSLSYWKIRVKGQTNNAYNLPPFLRQLNSTAEVKFLPANTVRSIKTTNNSLTSSALYSIPFKPLHSGFLLLPELRLQYFDPDNKKIITVVHKIKTVFVLSGFWRGIIGTLIFIFFIYLSLFGYRKWEKLAFSKRKREQAVFILEEGNNIENVRKATQLLAEAEYWPANITIYQWADNWKIKYQTNTLFENIIKKMSLLFYSEDKNKNVKEQSQQLLQLVHNRRKR